LPEHTAPAAFLKAREKYFSFYPMFIVPMGPGPDRLGVDYPNQQRKMEQLRMDIGKQSYNTVIASITIHSPFQQIQNL
jgi:patched 1 protein